MNKRTHEEDIHYYIPLYGYVPWSVTIAAFLEAGKEWDSAHIAKVLRDMQNRLDAYKVKEKEEQHDT